MISIIGYCLVVAFFFIILLLLYRRRDKVEYLPQNDKDVLLNRICVDAVCICIRGR